jgi:hypothetical protein
MALTFCKNQQPIERIENNVPIFATYLPTMTSVIELESEEANVRKVTFKVDFGEVGLKRRGNLVGLAGFFYDANYYWATTVDNVIKAWDWFTQKIQADDIFYECMESIIVRDFFALQIETGLTPHIISLALDLYALDSMNVDVRAKLSEIHEHVNGNIRNYAKSQIQIGEDKFTLSPQTISHDYRSLRNLRSKLTDLSSETKLARLACLYGHKVKLLKKPDLIIDDRSVDVKRPRVTYKLPSKPEFITFMTEDESHIENLSSSVSRGIEQNVDVIALHVNHLNKRDIQGFKTNWLGKDLLKKALSVALSCNMKGTLLLFKENPEGYFGKVVLCKALKR